MHPGRIVIVLHVVVGILVDGSFTNFVFGVLEVQANLILRWFDCLRAKLAFSLFVVIHEFGQCVRAERTRFGWIGTSTVENDQSWSSLTIIKPHIIVLEDHLALTMIHQTEVKSVPVYSGQTRQIPHHVVSWLHDSWRAERRAREHDEPRLRAPVCIDDPVGIALIIEESYAGLTPLLIDPVVHA